LDGFIGWLIVSRFSFWHDISKNRTRPDDNSHAAGEGLKNDFTLIFFISEKE
jgi:hypothetical protein